MNDGLLSQEELNALLNDESNSSIASQDSDNQTILSDNEKDVLGEIGNIAMGGAATTLSILLNNKVSITTPTITVTDVNDIKEDSTSNYLVVEVAYKSGLEGLNLFAIKENDALIISDLMKGGDGTNPPIELNELAMSSISEAMNQMMGASATSMSNIFNKKVAVEPPQLSLMDFSDSEAVAKLNEKIKGAVVRNSFKMEIGSLVNSQIIQMMSVEVAKELVESLAKKTESMSTSSVVDNDMIGGQTYAEPPYTAPKPLDKTTGSGFQQVKFSSLTQQDNPPLEGNIGLLMDVPLQVKVELGRTKKLIRDILDLGPGSVIELDRLAGEPVDVFVNTKLIAKGEVVVIDENFGVRIIEIVNPFDRINHLQ